MAEGTKPLPSSIKEYEASPLWRKKSKKILDDKECTCEICGRRRWKEYVRKPGTYKRLIRFSVHHKTYVNVPNEKDEDLMTLCWLCHDTAHLILRCSHLGGMWPKLREVVKEYFIYDREEL